MGGELKAERRPGRPGSYREVYNHFAELIDSGKLKQGDQLPTYPEIERHHKVSHATATKAIGLLKEDLYVISSTKGIFVHLGKHKRLWQRLTDILNELEQDGQQLQMEMGRSGCSLAGRDGAVCWNPELQSWEMCSH